MQHVVPEVTIPPEVTPENVTTTIVDTSCEWDTCPARPSIDPQPIFEADGPSRNHLISQLVRAHVICLVYSIAEPSTFERVAEYWLPLFRREGVNVCARVSCYQNIADLPFEYRFRSSWWATKLTCEAVR